jgi:hypothetical protein
MNDGTTGKILINEQATSETRELTFEELTTVAGGWCVEGSWALWAPLSEQRMIPYITSPYMYA